MIDYEKKYKKALDRAKAQWGSVDDETRSWLEGTFPELAESEDERIRAVILKLMLGMRDEIFTAQDELVTKPKVLAWLEKQKEQKPINESNMHEPTLDEARKWNEAYEKGYSLGYKNGRNEQKPAEIAPNQFDGITYGMQGCSTEKSAERFEEAREKYQVEWSEEDERIRKAILGFLNPDKGGTKYSSNAKLVEWSNWLKYLPMRCPKSSDNWKPSKEQMDSLHDTIVQTKGYSYSIYLPELYEQLKKLM